MTVAPRTATTAIPLLFVFLWSTGFVGARGGLPAAEPFTFLALRMGITLGILTLVLPFFRVAWPTRVSHYGHLAVVGLLIHGVYLGGIFAAIDLGMPSSVAALVVGLQPLVTVILARAWLGESLTPGKMAGLAIGFAGVILVVGLQPSAQAPVNATALGLCVASLLAISVGTIYQKRFCTDLDLLPGVFVQYTANAAFMLLLALALETRVIHWSAQFVLSLGWLILALSLGAVFLLMWLIRHGEAGKVASLFYLVPAFTAVEAWLLFDETFPPQALAGFACCAIGVALVIRQPKSGL